MVLLGAQGSGCAADGVQRVPFSMLNAFGNRTSRGTFFLPPTVFYSKLLFSYPAEGEERKNQVGNLDFTKSLAVLTEVRIHGELLLITGPLDPGANCLSPQGLCHSPFSSTSSTAPAPVGTSV